MLAENAPGTLLPAARIVRVVLSDDAGAWSAFGLEPSKRYAVIAYDHTGVHDPVIKMNLVPTVD